MNDFVAIVMGMLVSFALGAGLWLYLLRGFIGPWVSAKRGGGLLVEVISKAGDRSKFVCAKPAQDRQGAYIYTGIDGQQHVLTPHGVRRAVRTSFIQVLDGDTSPLIPQKTVVDTTTRRVLDDQGTPKTNQNGEFLVEEVPYRRVFEHWDDSQTLDNLIMRAALKPKVPLGARLNKKTIIFILIGLGVVVYLVMSMGGGGAPTI